MGLLDNFHFVHGNYLWRLVVLTHDAKALRLTAQLPTVVAAFHRRRQELDPIAPRMDLDHAANFLYMLTGERPSAAEIRAFDLSLTLHADHELNASTFAALVTISTLSAIA